MLVFPTNKKLFINNNAKCILNQNTLNKNAVRNNFLIKRNHQ